MPDLKFKDLQVGRLYLIFYPNKKSLFKDSFFGVVQRSQQITFIPSGTLFLLAKKDAEMCTGIIDDRVVDFIPQGSFWFRPAEEILGSKE